MLVEIFLKDKIVLKNRKIAISDWFIKLLTKNSMDFLPIICSKILPETMHDFNVAIEELTNTVIKNKEMLISNEIKDTEKIMNSIVILSSFPSFDANFPELKLKTNEFRIIFKNIITLSNIYLREKAIDIGKIYQNGDKTEKELEEIQKLFEDTEKEVFDCLRFFTLQNKNFIFGFFQVIKLFFAVEEIIKINPDLTSSQKYNIFSIYRNISPILKTFFTVINFTEMKSFENIKKTEILNEELILPEMKRINTKEESFINDDILKIEKTLSNISKIDEFSFDDVFNLICKVQESFKDIIIKIDFGKSASVYKIFFEKIEKTKIYCFLKMAYIG